MSIVENVLKWFPGLGSISKSAGDIEQAINGELWSIVYHELLPLKGSPLHFQNIPKNHRILDLI